METQNHKTHLKRSKILVVEHLPSLCEMVEKSNEFNPYYHPKKRKRKNKEKEKRERRWEMVNRNLWIKATNWDFKNCNFNNLKYS